MKPGVYIVKNNISERRYIVALNGVDPFIRITNTIDLVDFTNGFLSKDTKVINEIMETPNNFTFVYLSNEIESKPEVAEEDKKSIVVEKEDYNFFTRDENIDECGDLLFINTVSDIQAKCRVSWHEAERIYQRVLETYNEEDKWKKIKEKSSSMSEGNSVIN